MAVYSGRLLLIAAAIYLLFWVLGKLWSILLPVVLGLLIATVLWPATRFLRKHRWPPALAASTVLLAAVAIFVFISAWNNFLWPFISTNDGSILTLPVGLQTIKSAYGIQYAQNMASALLAALPLILVFLFFQRQIIKGVATTGLAGT